MILIDFVILLNSKSVSSSCSRAQVDFHENILSGNFQYMWTCMTVMHPYDVETLSSLCLFFFCTYNTPNTLFRVVITCKKLYTVLVLHLIMY